MPTLLLIFSLFFPTVALRKSRGYLYGFCFSIVLYFCLVTIWSIFSQIATGSLNHGLIQYTVIGSEFIYIYLQYRQGEIHKIMSSPYVLAAVISIIVIFASGITFNSVRLYSNSGSVPVIGTNDDNANHMAMTTAAIKGNALLFDNKIVDKAINDSIIMPVSRWYPIGLYANTTHLYYIFDSLSAIPLRYNLSLLFSLFAIYVPFQLIIFLFLFFKLVDGTYSSRSIASFIFLFTVGIFIVMSEFFLKLFIYGFHSQLLGFNLILVLFIESREIARRTKMCFTEMLLISILLVSIGLTYYLFIPVAAVMYLLLHVQLKRSVLNYVPYAAVVVSMIPLILFNTSQQLVSINATTGVAFISITGLFISMIGILFCALMREKRDTYMRMTCILVTGLTILQMIIGSSSYFISTFNFGYYFFKSYWTIGLFGLPPLLAYISRKVDNLTQGSRYKRIFITSFIFCLSGIIFYAVFSQDKQDDKGYDLLLHVSNGYVNYFPANTQRRWIVLSNKFEGQNGKNIYVLGQWGKQILGYFVYGDAPSVVKTLYQQGRWSLSQNTIDEYTQDIITKLLNKRDIHVIDNEGIIKKYILFISEQRIKEIVKASNIFE